MDKKEGDGVRTLLSRLGDIPRSHRSAFERAELVRTNGDHTLFYASPFEKGILEQHVLRIQELVGTPVKLQFRAHQNGVSAAVAPAVHAPADLRPRLPAPDIAAGDMVDYDALHNTFTRAPFMHFDNNRAAVDILRREVIDRFPGQLPQKTRPYTFVGGVGVGKTSTIEHTVHELESRRRKAVAAFQEHEYSKALALARDTVGNTPNTEPELWQRAYALATSRICYESAQRIKNDWKEIGELSHAGKKDLADARAARFHTRHKNLDLWAIDDMQLLAQGKPTGTLEQVFSMLSEIYDRRKPVLITSDKSPAVFDNFPEHTRSRLSENICNIVLPTEEDKRTYTETRFAALRQAGHDFSTYEKDWLPMIVRVASHYRNINGLFNNITNNGNGNGQKKLFNPAQLFEQALDMIAKETKEAHGAYDVRRIISTIVSLAGITERDLKTSEVEMKRYNRPDELYTKRAALVLAAGRTALPPEDLGQFLGYAGVTPGQRAATVKRVLEECGKIYVDSTMPIEQQFMRVRDAVRENLEKRSSPLYAKK